ncbi:hypothetical protein Q1W73_10470 [Asticcacaulis sp. ZE23SCel15]|jgi:hypothetical protein|uniref:RloB domain-containing protein n=1 Tax=Asticcacaulis sp. ZE23SCel15 TaxID=3059027 RepID=UPI00265F060D|nr:RloB domain-containing protein [Asticcacaulis sp. ZE23SCel15]WKL56123.1 hypothetical protein Q1W73_10470 [Asticcacaulis sp. ZE23SCel15]
MKTRRGHIPPRKRFFVGCEGESEQSYVQVLQRLCDDAGLHVHLHAELLGGGDALKRLETAERKLPRLLQRSQFEAKFALLDTDQLSLSVENASKAAALEQKLGITVIWQKPCHEGLLAKHFVGANKQPLTANDAMAHLHEFWPEYQKAMTAQKVASRIDLAAAHQAAAQIKELRNLLICIGLILPHA